MKNYNKARQKGFTLIEVMVVVVVIGLMGAIIVPRVFEKVQQAQDTAMKQDILQIEAALKFYRLDNFRYPSSSEGLNALVTKPSSAKNWNGPYLDKVPVDPFQNPYRYAYPSTHGNDFDVFSYGADNQAGGTSADADIGNWNISE